MELDQPCRCAYRYCGALYLAVDLFCVAISDLAAHQRDGYGGGRRPVFTAPGNGGTENNIAIDDLSAIPTNLEEIFLKVVSDSNASDNQTS